MSKAILSFRSAIAQYLHVRGSEYTNSAHFYSTFKPDSLSYGLGNLCHAIAGFLYALEGVLSND